MYMSLERIGVLPSRHVKIAYMLSTPMVCGTCVCVCVCNVADNV